MISVGETAIIGINKRHHTKEGHKVPSLETYYCWECPRCGHVHEAGTEKPANTHRAPLTCQECSAHWTPARATHPDEITKAWKYTLTSVGARPSRWELLMDEVPEGEFSDADPGHFNRRELFEVVFNQSDEDFCQAEYERLARPRQAVIRRVANYNRQRESAVDYTRCEYEVFNRETGEWEPE